MSGFELELWSYRDKEAAQAIVSDLGKVGIKVNLKHGKLAGLNKARKERKKYELILELGVLQLLYSIYIHWRDP